MRKITSQQCSGLGRRLMITYVAPALVRDRRRLFTVIAGWARHLPIAFEVSNTIDNLCFANITIEVNCVEVTIDNSKLIILGIYRPIDSQVEDFFFMNSLL